MQHVQARLLHLRTSGELRALPQGTAALACCLLLHMPSLLALLRASARFCALSHAAAPAPAAGHAGVGSVSCTAAGGAWEPAGHPNLASSPHDPLSALLLPPPLSIQCRFKHTRQQGPPPDPETLEAAKPREHRNLNIVANQANENIMPEREARGPRRGRGGPGGDYPALPAAGGAAPGAMQQYRGPGGAQQQQGRGYGAPGQVPGFVDPALLAAVGQQDLRFGF